MLQSDHYMKKFLVKKHNPVVVLKLDPPILTISGGGGKDSLACQPLAEYAYTCLSAEVKRRRMNGYLAKWFLSLFACRNEMKA